MAPLFSWLSPSKPTPPPIGVHIIPCGGLDLGSRSIVLTFGFLIDARLDPKKLETTLSLLVERKFPRAGARLALRNGIHEYHIPHAFDARTPAVAFTVEDYPEAYSSSERPSIEHLLVSSATEPWICDAPPLQPYLKSKACPSSLKEFLAPNTPLLHVHVAAFDDLTFVGVTTSHLLFDTLGMRELLHAWTRLLSGDQLEDIPGMKWDMDPFSSFVVPTKVQPPGWFDIGWFPKVVFIVYFILHLVRDSKEVGKLVCVPKAFLEEQKRTVMDELNEEKSSEWVGSSDVLMAWWFKTVYAHRTDATPLHIHVPMNVRGTRVFPGNSPIATPYISNAVSSIAIPPLPVNSLPTTSLRDLALRFRRTINGYSADIPGIVEELRWRSTYPLKVLFPCAPGAEYSMQSNWRSARFAELDFSGAILNPQGRAPARVLVVIPITGSGENIPLRGSGAVLFEDERVIWMSQIRGSKDWEGVRKAGRLHFMEEP